MKTGISGIFFAVGIAVLLAGANMAEAAQNDVKIGIINIQKVIAGSKAARAGQKKVISRQKQLKDKIIKEEQKFIALQDEIEKKKTVWPQDLLRKKTRELQKMSDIGKIMTRDANTEIQELQGTVMEPILKEIQQIIADIGKKEGFALIFEHTGKGLKSTTGLLYADQKMDISDLVLKKLEKRLAK